MTRILGLLVVGLVLASCGSERCDAPAGCLRAERVAGACTCTSWEIVSTEPVRLPFVVTGLIYPLAGTASVLSLGTTWDPAMVPESASIRGTLLRSVIRRADGTDVIARIGALDERVPAERVTATSVLMGWGGGVMSVRSPLDLNSPGQDDLALFTNLVVTVGTDAVGGKTVDWSWAPPCFFPLGCQAAEPATVTPRLIRGETHWDAYHDDYLASLSTAERAALLALDPYGAGSTVAWPRYQDLGAIELTDAMEPAVRAVTWLPCTDPAGFEVLAETAVPMSGGDTFVLQYGVQHDAACAPQRPGLLAGTTTPGCSLSADVLVDRLSGALLMEPAYSTSACTRH